MERFLQYELKVAAVLAVFYLFYRLLLGKETFLKVNRVVLLSTAVLSLVLPLCVITVRRVVEMPAVPLIPRVATDVPSAVAIDGSEFAFGQYNAAESDWWFVAICIVLGAGTLVVISKTIISIVRTSSIIRRGRKVYFCQMNSNGNAIGQEVDAVRGVDSSARVNGVRRGALGQQVTVV